MSAYNRKKQPEHVKRLLLECASKICYEQGLPAVTVQAVATAAGVTKGGLFHHFPSKQALIDAMFAHQLEEIDSEVDALIAKDPNRIGSFTRAYIDSTLAMLADDEDQPNEPVSISALCDPELNRSWLTWLRDRLERHKETDSGPIFDIARAAADGLWLIHITNNGSGAPISASLSEIRDQLHALTHQPFLSNVSGNPKINS